MTCWVPTKVWSGFLCLVIFNSIIFAQSPTIEIARVGSGVVNEGTPSFFSEDVIEGDKIEFTVSLLNSLSAGQRVDVQLAFSGRNVDTFDFNDLALKTGDGLNTGVTIEDSDTLTPTVIFQNAGARVATLEIEATDSLYEDLNESVTVAIASNTVLAADTDTTVMHIQHSTRNSFNATMKDNEYQLSFSRNTYSVSEGAGSLSLTVNLDRAQSDDVIFWFLYEDDSATSPADYEETSTYPDFLEISSGSTTHNAEIVITDNNLVEGTERFRVFIRPFVLPDNLLNPSAWVEISDNDPTVKITADTSSVIEGSPASFTVSRNLATGSALAVRINVADAGPTDYIDASAEGNKTVSIPANSTSVTHTVPTLGNNTQDSGGGVTVDLQPPTSIGTYYLATQDSATITVEDDDTPGVTIKPLAVSVYEADLASTTDRREDQTTYTIKLAAAPVDQTGDLMITLFSSNSGAVTFSPNSVSFNGTNWNTEQTVTLTGQLDGRENSNSKRAEMIHHTLRGASSRSNYGTVIVSPVSVDVLDVDPVLTLSGSQVNEGDSGTTNLIFTATLSLASSKTVTARYTFSPDDSTAVVDNDFSIPLTDLTDDGFVVTFNPGEIRQTITVLVNGDAVREADETIVLSLQDPTNARFATPGTSISAQGTIRNDDTEALVTSISGSINVAESDDIRTSSVRENEANWTVRLAKQPTGDITLKLRSLDSSIATISPSTISFTTANWNVNRNVTVTGVPDDFYNTSSGRSVNVGLLLLAAGTNYAGSPEEFFSVVVTDDELPPVISIVGATVAEGSNPPSTTDLPFTLTLSHLSERHTYINYALAPSGHSGTATSGDDYDTIMGGTLAIDPKKKTQSLVVSVKQDMVVESNETVVIRFSSPQSASLKGGVTSLDVTGTIADDDSTVSVALRRLSDSSIQEGGGSIAGEKVEFTVRLQRTLRANERIDVPLSITGTNVTASDFGTLKVITDRGLSKGVTVEDPNTLTPTVVFKGPQARLATLEMEANDLELETPQQEVVTFSLASDMTLGADSDTTVGGVQRDASNYTFNTTVIDDEYLVSFDLADRVYVPEGQERFTFDVNMSRSITRDVFLNIQYFDDADRTGSVGPSTVGTPGDTTSGLDY